MPRPATGTVKLIGGRWHARIRVPGGGRPLVELPPGIDEAKARQLAVIQQRLVKERGVLAADEAPQGETFAQYTPRWVKHRVERGMRSAPADEGRIAAHTFDQLGALPMVKITREHIEAWVERIDDRVRRGELSPKTGRNQWGLLTKLFSDACRSKVRALRVIASNPCTDVAGPDRGRAKSRTFLYPAEASALFACERVPLAFRRIVALSIYLYTRAAELAALEWEDVDLAHGVVRIHRALDPYTNEAREPKTAAGIRSVPIEPTLRPLLDAMHREAGGVGRVVRRWDRNNAAEDLRAALTVAGLTRAALFTSDTTRKRLSFHDLRASGITWCVLRGDEPVKVQRRAGHEDFETTLGYTREVEALRGGFGEPFPALPACLLGEGFGPGKDHGDEGEKAQRGEVPPQSSASARGTVSLRSGFDQPQRGGITSPGAAVSQPVDAFGHARGPFDAPSVALSLRAALALPYHDADDAWLAAEVGGLS